jgi:serine/threonine protein kinase
MQTRVEELVAKYLDLGEETSATRVADLKTDAGELWSLVIERVDALRSCGLASDPLPERLGPFRLLEKIGSGGMGVVYRAIQEPLGRVVALKVLRPELRHVDSARQRFLREAEATAKLDHPGIITVHTVGESSGIAYIAMSFVDGVTLAHVLHALAACEPAQLDGTVVNELVGCDRFAGSWAQVCTRICLDVASALRFAHDWGLLHRDVKPSNVILAKDGRVLLLDFGLARHFDLTADVGTKTASLVGTLPYLPPERLKSPGTSATAADDIYSLGVVYYELLALRHPFSQDTDCATRATILQATPPQLSKQYRRMPADVETLCLSAIDPEPGQRCPSMATLAADLDNILSLRPIRTRRLPWHMRLKRFAQRRPAVASSVVLGSLLVSASVALMVSRMRSEEFATELNRVASQYSDLRRISERGLYPSMRTGPDCKTETEAIAEWGIRAQLDLASYFTETALFSKAVPLVEAAALATVDRYGPESHEHGLVLLEQASLQRRRRSSWEGHMAYQESVRILATLGESARRDLAKALLGHARLLRDWGSWREAGLRLGECRQVLDQLGAVDSVLQFRYDLASAAIRGERGELADGDAAFGGILSRAGLMGTFAPSFESDVLENWALWLRSTGRIAAAEVRWRQLIDLSRHRISSESGEWHYYHLLHGKLLRQLNRLDEAEAALSVAHRVAADGYGPMNSWSLPDALRAIAHLRVAQHRFAEAEVAARGSIDLHENHNHGAAHRGWSLAVLAEAQNGQGKILEARATLREALRALTEALGTTATTFEDSLQLLESWTSLRYGEQEIRRLAAKNVRALIVRLEKGENKYSDAKAQIDTCVLRGFLGRLIAETGSVDGGRRMAEVAWQSLSEIAGRRSAQSRRTARRLAQICRIEDDEDGARHWTGLAQPQ